MSMQIDVNHTTRMKHRVAARKPETSLAARDPLAAKLDDWAAGTAAVV